MILFEKANERYAYFSDTGVVIDRRTGFPAGHEERNRRTTYIRFSAFGKTVRAHQIAWLLYYRCWPEGEVDHRDGDGMNNRIQNLRVVSRARNQRNQRLSVRNRSGVTGVSWHTPSGKWQAHIWVDGKRKFLGRFKRLKHAASARALAAAANGYGM